VTLRKVSHARRRPAQSSFSGVVYDTHHFGKYSPFAAPCVDDLGAVAGGKQLTIQTVDGSTVDGYCLSINVDEIAITTKDQRIVRIARKTLSRIHVQRSQNDGHQLRALGRGIHKGLRKEVDWLFSPYAPLGIVAVPATLAWAAVSAPFCLLGDLTHANSGTREIKVI
jgi:hypothetical protein